jgi:pimeloyl-ACP methyl ester carboxylesterase
VGGDWKRTKQEAFRTGRQRAGVWGTARFLFYGSWLYVPGPFRPWALRHVMTDMWHNYFLDPRTAPDPDQAWLAGCSAEAMLRTDRAITREDSNVLRGLSAQTCPVMVVYGEHDILGTSADIVRHRLPHALQVTLHGSGHLHWLQGEPAYREALRHFYSTDCEAIAWSGALRGERAGHCERGGRAGWLGRRQRSGRKLLAHWCTILFCR